MGIRPNDPPLPLSCCQERSFKNRFSENGFAWLSQGSGGQVAIWEQSKSLLKKSPLYLFCFSSPIYSPLTYPQFSGLAKKIGGPSQLVFGKRLKTPFGQKLQTQSGEKLKTPFGEIG